MDLPRRESEVGDACVVVAFGFVTGCDVRAIEIVSSLD
jgi:hypothetical protein